MFAYCNNNPANGCDPCGTCFHRLDFWNDCAKCGGRTLGDKCETFRIWLGELDIASTKGIYVSGNTGIFNFTGTLELALDSELNIQVNGSLSFDVSTAGSPSFSAGSTSSVFLVPDVSYLEGGTSFMGGSLTVPIPKTPIAVVGGLNVGQTTDGYWGAVGAAGIAPAAAAGFEVHGGYSETWRLSGRINIWALLSGLGGNK